MPVDICFFHERLTCSQDLHAYMVNQHEISEARSQKPTHFGANLMKTCLIRRDFQSHNV